VTSKTIIRNGWVEKIKENLLPGDILVCFLEQNAPSRGIKSQSIVQAITGKLPCPVYVLRSFRIKEVQRQELSQFLLGWTISIIMILLFLGFDIRIVQDASGWIRNILLGTAMLVEASLIWSWNARWN
jgi:hypothetical protein